MRLKSLMEHYSWLEVMARRITRYFSFPKKILKKINTKKKKNIGLGEHVGATVLKDYLRGQGITNGDILIVHSSLRPLKCFGMSPEDVIDMLLELVGETGTLVMPAFPMYDEHISGKFEEISTQEYVYDIQESPAWTGIITDLFWRRADVIRSRFPDNPLAAHGKYAKEMFEQEKEGDLAHGQYSAWKFCSEHHAKVLFLGIPAFNAITEIHLSEDILDEDWPILGWFKERKYEIRDGEKVYKRITRIRKQFWSKYLTEYRCSYELRKHNLLKEELLKAVPISYIPDLAKLEEFVTERALEGDLLIFRIPKRYYRK